MLATQPSAHRQPAAVGALKSAQKVAMVHTVPNWALRCYTINWHSGVQYLYWAWH
jgi:hypothetical protein